MSGADETSSLLATAADQRRFVPAGARLAAKEAGLKHRNTLIIGAPGSGKTSLLNHIAFTAREHHGQCILVSARLIDGPRTLVDLLLAEAQDADWVEHQDPPAKDDPLGPARQIRRLRDAPPGGIVLVDDPTAEQVRTLFGQLRDELWQTPVSFAVAVGPAVARVLEQAAADAFFDTKLTLEPFDREDATQLLARLRETGSELAVDQPPSYPLQPRALIAIADGDEVQSRLDPKLQYELLEVAEQTAGRSAAMLLAEIWDRGPVSASDLALQRSVGVSRSRLTELLRALTAARVLESYPDPSAGRAGRPRTLYRVDAER